MTSLRPLTRSVFFSPLARAATPFAPLVLLALLPIAFFAQVIFTGGNWGREAFALRWPIAYYAAQAWRSGEIPLWNPYFFGGTPFLAHPEANALYPFVLLFAFLPAGWAMQIYALAPFSMSTVFTYLLARRLGLSGAASTLCAVVYAFHFARVAPLGHVQLQHTAAWLPLLLYALESLLQSPTAWTRYGALLALGLTAQGLGMHAQVFAYSIVLLILYAGVRLFQNRSTSPFGPFKVGLSLAAGILALPVVFLPLVEFLPLSSRSAIDFQAFTLFAFKPADLLQLIHPFLQVHPSDPGWTVEARLYFGAAPLLLAAVGVISRKPRTLLFALLFALAVLLSTETALTPLIYKIPVLNLFRVQSRWMIPGGLFLALLAGSGLDHVLASPSKRVRILLLSCAAIFLALFLLTTRERIGLLLVPLAIAAVSGYLVLSLCGRSAGPWLQLRLIILVLVDLWYVFQPPRANPMPLAQTIGLQTQIAALVTSEDDVDRTWRQCYSADDVSNENLYGPWPLITSYNPWMARALQDLTRFDGSCTYTQDFWQRKSNLVPDLLHVRYIQVPASVWNGLPMMPCITSGEEACFGQRYTISLPPGGELTFDLGEAITIDELALSTYLTNGTDLGQGERVGEVVLEGAGGGTEILPVLAGVHTAQWSFDCPEGGASVRHARPDRASEWTLGDCTGNYWIGLFKPSEPFSSPEITLLNVSPEATIVIDAASVRSTERVWSALNMQRTQAKRDFGGFEEISSLDPRWVMLRRPMALPYAWSVERVERLEAEALAASLRGEGPELAIASVAYLIDEDAAAPDTQSVASKRFDAPTQISLVERGAGEILFTVSSEGPSFMVLSEVFYPGWKAWIDGREVPLFKVDYILRGLETPAGSHEVRLAFQPRSVSRGLWLSLAGVMMILGLLLGDVRSALTMRKEEQAMG